MKKYIYITLELVAVVVASWWYLKPSTKVGVVFNSTQTENLVPYTNNFNGIGNSSFRYKDGWINNSTSTTVYTSTLSAGSTTPKNLTSGKVLASNSQAAGCLGGCAWYPMIGAAVEGINYQGGEGGHFKSTEVYPTNSMECFTAMGDVFPDGHGLYCTYGSLTATIIDTYSVSPPRSPSWGSFTGPGSFGFGTSTADSTVSISSQSVATTTLSLDPFLAQTANILTVYDTITATTPTDVITGWDGISKTNYWGLGTSTPLGKLSVKGSGTGSGTSFVVSNASNAQNFTVLDNGMVGVGLGATQPIWDLTVADTRPSIALSDIAASTNQKTWTISAQGGNLYVSTSTDAGATTTPALTIQGATRPPVFAFATSSSLTNNQDVTGFTQIFSLGLNPNTASSTVSFTGKSEMTIKDAGGTIRCAFWDLNGAFTTITGPCNN